MKNGPLCSENGILGLTNAEIEAQLTKQPQPMKAITIWQPYASLLAIGAKLFETRSWATTYRGPIAIHAAARKCDTKGMPGLAVHEAIRALRPFTQGKARTTMYLPLELLPLGAVIATAELVGCHEILGDKVGLAHTNLGWLEGDGHHGTFDEWGCFHPSEKERLFGDWTPGRFAWEFVNMQMLPEPIPAKGKQGLWNWGGSE